MSLRFNRVQLRRNALVVLPFRLVGAFHVDTGLYDPSLLESAKKYLMKIDHDRVEIHTGDEGGIDQPNKLATSLSAESVSDEKARDSVGKGFLSSWFGGGKTVTRAPIVKSLPAAQWVGLSKK